MGLRKVMDFPFVQVFLVVRWEGQLPIILHVEVEIGSLLLQIPFI